MSMPRIAIIGSRNWNNKNKTKDIIWQLKQRFGDDLTIISGGCLQGADKLARKYAIEMGVNYVEYNPAHTVRNLYSAMPENYYGKEYHITQFHHRNNLIAAAADYCIALIPKDAEKSNGTVYTIKRFKKLDKKVVIIE
jgi:predicted Rossmann fold nucleotide-binding protein DprA/Smf involved in DNA uptake